MYLFAPSTIWQWAIVKDRYKAYSVFLALLSSLQYIQVKERERQKGKQEAKRLNHKR